MKTTTKLSIISLSLLTLFILISSFTKSESDGKYATMRTVEGSLGGSKIILAYEGRTQELDLDKSSIGNMTPNTLKINQAINLLAALGYQLVSQSGGEQISNYSFVKK